MVFVAVKTVVGIAASDLHRTSAFNVAKKKFGL